jgi:hypothetical protein
MKPNLLCITTDLRHGRSSSWAGWTAILLGLVLCLGWASQQATAQVAGTGSIQGTVTDPSGAVVAGATVTAMNTDTSVETEVVSTKAGFFVVSLVKPGVYTVTVAASGFQTLVQQNVTVDALQTISVNAKLTVGSASQSITVTSAPSMLMTDDVKQGSYVENETYDSLPLAMNGAARDPSAFVGLSVGVEGYSTQAAGPSTGGFNGGQTYQNETYVEGIPMTSAGTEGETRNLAFGISVEAVEQFQVATSGMEATYEGQGMSNYVVKSGSDKFHGGVYEYFRNTIFDVRGFFSPVVATALVPLVTPERQNEFGGIISGPVPFLKHKLFFFANYDGYRYDSGIQPSYQNIPTVGERTGDFSAEGAAGFHIYDTNSCTAVNASGSCTARTQFTSGGNADVIPSGRLSKVSQSFQSYLPAPSPGMTDANYAQNYLATLPNLVNNDSGTLKIDYNMTDKNRMFGIFSRGKYANPIVGSLSAATPTSNATLPTPYTDGRSVIEYSTLAQIHDEYTVTSNMVNDLGWGVSRLWIPLTNVTDTVGYPTKAGLTGLPPGVASNGFPDITFTGNDVPVSWAGTNSHAYNEAQTTFTAVDNLLWTKGRHHFTYGFQWQALQDNENVPLTGTQAGFTFANQETQNFCGTTNNKAAGGPCDGTAATATSLNTLNTGLPYAGYMLGQVDGSTVTQNSVAETGGRYKTYAPYIQDNINVNSKLTVNLGLRYDLWTPFVEVENRMSFFNPTLANPLAGGIPGALQFAGYGTDACNCRTPVKIHKNNYAPRAGFAYKLNNTTVVRASYGIFYSHAGGVGGRTNGRQGLSQVGFNNNGSLGSTISGMGAYYTGATNNSTGAGANGSRDNGYPGNPTAPPFINPSYGIGNIVSPGPSGSASNPLGIGPGTAQTVTFGDPAKGGQAPQYQDWAFNIQHSFSSNMTLSAAYSASVGHHLPGAGVAGPMTDQVPTQYLPLGALLTTTLVNNSGVLSAPTLASVQAKVPGFALPYANFVGTVAQALKPFPQYVSISDPWLDVANENYHALQLSLNRRMSSGLTFMLNYTFSKEIDDIAGVRNPDNDRLERSIGGINHTHVLQSTAVYKLPFGAGHKLASENIILRNILGGWQVSAIYTASSGAPLSVTGTCTGYGVIDATCIPNYTPVGSVGQIGGIWAGGSPWQNPKPKNATDAKTVHYLNPNAFSNPAAGTWGNAARTAPLKLFVPRIADADVSLRRNFAIWNGLKFSLQGDAFNVLNAVYLSAPNTALPSTLAAYTTGTFGTYSGQANSPRKLQFSARLTF